jgi:hypothetical protein
VNIYVKGASDTWEQLIYEQAKYHSYFPKPFMSITLANAQAACFSANTVDASELWRDYQDLKMNTSAWSDHYRREHQEQQLAQEPATGPLKIRLSSDIPAAPYQNPSVFTYAGLGILRRDIWQILYASAFVVIALRLLELVHDQGLQVTVPFLFLMYLNMLSFYANENIRYVWDSALWWWWNDIKNFELIWVLLKGGLIASIGLVLHTVSKVDLRLQSCGAAFTVVQAVLRAVAVGLLALNLYLGYQGGNWASLWLHGVTDPSKKRGPELDLSEQAQARREWEA